MIVGIDIGGTKTHILNERVDGARQEWVVDTSEWRKRRDPAADTASLAALIGSGQDGIPQSIVVGAHGCDTDADCLKLQELLSRHFEGVVLVLNDAELLLPAVSRTGGVAVVAGTGSIAVSRDAEGRMLSAGGWGWFLGDEGSASGLVRDAARAVRLSLDNGNPLEQLGEAMLAASGAASPVDLGRALSDLGSAARIGALVQSVFEAAESGSLLAQDVVRRGGDGLALLVQQLAERGAAADQVVTAGGVITRQASLLSGFEDALARRVPGARLSLLSEPPVSGALVLAQALADGQQLVRLPRPHRKGRQSAADNGRAA